MYVGHLEQSECHIQSSSSLVTASSRHGDVALCHRLHRSGLDLLLVHHVPSTGVGPLPAVRRKQVHSSSGGSLRYGACMLIRAFAQFANLQSMQNFFASCKILCKLFARFEDDLRCKVAQSHLSSRLALRSAVPAALAHATQRYGVHAKLHGILHGSAQKLYCMTRTFSLHL